MAINYAKKYATKIAEAFVKPSITDDDCGKQYTWNGPNSRTIVVGSVDTVPEVEYNRTGDNRFGTTYDLGDTQQEMTCEKQPAFSFTIDALDQSDQAIAKSAARSLRRQGMSKGPEAEHQTCGRTHGNKRVHGGGTITQRCKAAHKIVPVDR